MTGIERLRELIDATLGYVRVASVTPHDYEYENDVEWDERMHLSELLASIYSQISREQDAMVVDSPYNALPQEDREAVAWVREHGGLGAVKRRWECLSYYADPVPRSCMEKRLARLQRQIDECHEALRRRNQRNAVLASEINRAHNENRMEFLRRAGNYTAFADEVCKRLAPQLRYVEGCTKDVMDAALEALDSRLMPEGCEWPRHESGELVGFGDDVSRHGEDFEANVIALYRDGSFSLNFWAYSKGERVKRVKRPAVPAADGKPLEAGQTVWGVKDGKEFVVVRPSCGDGLTFLKYRTESGGYVYTATEPEHLTHTKPEPPDSWERIADEIDRLREEVALHLGDYLYDEDGNDSIQLSMELIAKRCRALADRERGE